MQIKKRNAVSLGCIVGSDGAGEGRPPVLQEKHVPKNLKGTGSGQQHGVARSRTAYFINIQKLECVMVCTAFELQVPYDSTTAVLL